LESGRNAAKLGVGSSSEERVRLYIAETQREGKREPRESRCDETDE